MSHFTDIDIEIRDIEALRDACAELGLAMEANGEARGYGSRMRRAAHVIRLPGPYDIAVDRREDGCWNLAADLYWGHVEKAVGAGFGRLRQLYGVHRTLREARRLGLAARRTALPNGSVRLVLCRT